MSIIHKKNPHKASGNNENNKEDKDNTLIIPKKKKKVHRKPSEKLLTLQNIPILIRFIKVQ